MSIGIRTILCIVLVGADILFWAAGVINPLAGTLGLFAAFAIPAMLR